MGLSNSQYDSILAGYTARRLESKRLYNRKLEEIYNKCPEILDIDNKIAIECVRRTKQAIFNNEEAVSDLEDKIAAYSEQKRTILKNYGYPEDYLEEQYTCPLCKDTGFISGEQCSCFKKALSSLIYKESNLMEIVARENFSTFDLSLYSDELIPGEERLGSPKENMKNIGRKVNTFIKEFDSSFSNILLYGNTGVGKTFLTNCIAKELLDSAHSVLYYTAFEFFERLADITFHNGDTESYDSQDYLLNCDLLIIDDLGTELSNSFTVSALYSVLNERALKQKSTIISTNLSLSDMAERYSERVVSRLSKDYMFLKIIGRDIRCI